MPKSITSAQLKVIILSSLGGMLEFYDFVIFAIFAYPIGETFFPSESASLAIMAGFSAFAVGYLARPFGGILFSHFGDKYGRKQSFLITIMLMGGATLLMSLLPGYHQYGILMPVLFVLLRIIQGMAVGGEIPGAITYVSEHVNHRPALACAIVFMFINLGIVLAELMSALLEDKALLQFTGIEPWRIAFFVGGLLAIVSYFLRHKLEESPEFIAFQHENVRVPLFTLLSQHKSKLLTCITLVAIPATLVSMVYLFPPQYMKLTNLYNALDISMISLIALIIFSLACGLFGWIADYLGARRILLLGTLLVIVMTYLYYSAMSQQHHVLTYAVIISIACGMVGATFSTIISRHFPVKVRYTGIAFSYNVSFGVFGGLTPLIATSFVSQNPLSIAPAWIMVTVGCIGVIGMLYRWKVLKI